MSLMIIRNATRISSSTISATSGYHIEAMDWYARVIANGGTVSTATLGAVSRLCSAIEAAGIRSLITRLNLFTGDNLSACLVPLFRATSLTATTVGNATDINSNFVSDDYLETNGLTASSAGKSLNTGVPSSAMPANKGHSAWSIRNASYLANGFLFGFKHNAGYRSYNYILNNASQYIGCASGNTSEANAATSVYARWISSRTSLSSHTVYRNGVASVNVTTTVTATSGGSDVFGVFTNYTGATGRTGLHYYSIGDGMTATQALAYDAALAAFLASMGRS